MVPPAVTVVDPAKGLFLPGHINFIAQLKKHQLVGPDLKEFTKPVLVRLLLGRVRARVGDAGASRREVR